MSRLEELIQTHCPDGVEYSLLRSLISDVRERNVENKIEEVRSVTNSAGLVPTSEVFDRKVTSSDTSNYKVVRNSMFAYNPARINIGSIAYSVESDPVIVSPMYVVFSVDRDKILPSYLDCFLHSSVGKFQITSKVEQGVRFRLPIDALETISIPLPPLSVQEEIVRILDTFTALETELEAELAARTKQYEHYRNELLSFDSNSKIVEKLLADFCQNGVEHKDLGEIVDILDSQRKPVTKSDRKPGPYPYYGANGIQDYVAGYIFDGIYLLLGEDGSVINPDGSPILTWATGKIWVNNHAHVLAEKNNGALLRYLYYYLQTVDVSKVVRGVPPKINQENLRKIRVALPALEVQEQIVSILDRFDTLVNDLKSGLPAEIALRRKQYEYYRDKLLTFKPKPTD